MTDTTTKATVPAVLTGHALRSLRDAGYDFPTAVAEVIDNSIEAEANQIDVFLEEQEEGKKVHIRRVVIADDGVGMGTGPEGEDVLHHYLQLGYSTRYMSTRTIGKYGLGAKLAAFNFAEQIDVWSCADGHNWRHVCFDLERALTAEQSGRSVEIEEPDSSPLPEELKEFEPEGSGTIVVWSKIDRLEAGRLATSADQIRLELEKELSRIFREFIHGGIGISVGNSQSATALLPHDPLFLMDKSWADEVLTAEARRQAKAEGTKAGREGDGARKGRTAAPRHFPAEVVADEELKVAGSKARLRVTVYPEQVTRTRQSGGDALAKKLRVPENLGALSFMRLDREINYTTVPRILPYGVRDVDRFIGIEVRFNPELDEYFGVRHVKRGVEPHTGELRTEIRKRLKKYIPLARKKIEAQHDKAAQEREEHGGEHSAITDAVSDVNRTLPKGRVKVPDEDARRQRALSSIAEDTGKQGPERDEYVERVREQPVVIESVSFPGQSFLDIEHFSNQVIIRLNTRHRFYRELWEPIAEIAQQDGGTVSGDEAVRAARRTLEALSLLIVAYGKAESMNEDPHSEYTDLRNYWGQFLDTLMGKVKGVI